MKRTSWRNTAFSRAPVVRIYNEYPDQITQPVTIALVTDLHSTRYGAGRRCWSTRSESTTRT